MAQLVLLTTEEVAEILGLSVGTLDNKRSNGDGPPYVRIGRGSRAPIRYEQTALYKWIKEQSDKAAEEQAAKRAARAQKKVA